MINYLMNKVTLHEIFSDWAKYHPEKIAVVDEFSSITYSDLEEKTNKLALMLIELGVKTEDKILVHTTRTIDMLIALLGTLKAGAAYVPIDTQYPKERIDYIIDDTKSNIILTQKKLREKFSEGKNKILEVDQINWSDLKIREKGGIGYANSDNLAYILYTSGSTGIPKGVQIQHDSVINLLEDFNLKSKLSPNDNYGFWTSFGFDVSVYEIFSAFFNGGTLYVASNEIQINERAYFEWLLRNKISSCYIPPFMINNFANWSSRISDKWQLRRMLVGVEPIVASSLLQIIKNFKELIIINGYGPTETTICSTLYVINGDINVSEDKNTPIGKAIKNTQIFILNESLNEVDYNENGELYIGGMGVSRGYLNKPDLNKTSFINYKGLVLYKTGDIVRKLSDGNLEFIGRKDTQLKIRGLRIELSEIQLKLLEHPNIKEALVLPFKEDEETLLVAYIITDKELSNNLLRKFLNEKIPTYMIPSHFIIMEKYPITTNGKIDKRALPKPKLIIDKKFVEKPISHLEKKIISIWQSEFHTSQLSVADNFYDLGGHSLKAMYLASKMNEHLNCDITARDILLYSTIEGIAKFIKENKISSKRNLTKSNVEQMFFPITSEQKKIFDYQEENKNGTNFNIFFGYEVTGKINLNSLEKSLNFIIDKHESLRSSFILNSKGEVKLRIKENLKTELKLLKINEKETIKEKFLDNLSSFDLKNDTLIRGYLFTDECNGKQYFVIEMHHIIVDGASIEILFNDLINNYLGGDLTKNNLQFKDYTVWLKDFEQTIEYNAQKQYWLEKFHDGVPEINFPNDKLQEIHSAFDNDGFFEFNIPRKFYCKIKEFNKKNNVTNHMLFMTIYYMVLSEHSQSQDIVIGIPIDNRKDVRFENTIGLFANMLPVRINLLENLSFEEKLIKIKSELLNTYSNSELTIDKILSEIYIKSGIEYTSIYDTCFAFQSFNLPTIESEEVKFKKIDLQRTSSRLYMIWEIHEEENEIKGYIRYNNNKLTIETIKKITDNFIGYLSKI